MPRLGAISASLVPRYVKPFSHGCSVNQRSVPHTIDPSADKNRTSVFRALESTTSNGWDTAVIQVPKWTRDRSRSANTGKDSKSVPPCTKSFLPSPNGRFVHSMLAFLPGLSCILQRTLKDNAATNYALCFTRTTAASGCVKGGLLATDEQAA